VIDPSSKPLLEDLSFLVTAQDAERPSPRPLSRGRGEI
jgi:hypothetical protein